MTIENIVYENKNFIVDAPSRPLVDRLEGGHIRISPKVRVSDRTKLSPKLAYDYMLLSMLIGEAMTLGLMKRGVDIGIVNYQEMGNWGLSDPGGPIMHTHLFGRAKTATVQKYGEAVSLPRQNTGFYKNFKRLDDGDIKAIQSEIERLLTTEKYKHLIMPA